MTERRNNTRKALVLSVVSMLLCCAMLAGSTFAWFTDSASSGNNRIVAGNLDVKLSYKNAASDDYREVTSSTTDLFTNVEGGELLWEPGVVAVTYLRVENAGSLALKYKLSIFAEDLIVGEDEAGVAALSKVLKAAVVPGDTKYVSSAEAINAAEEAGAKDLLEFFTEGELKAGDDADTLALIVYFPSEIGNAVEGVLYNRDDVALTTSLKLNLVATQAPDEEDSFGPDYDADADYPLLQNGYTLNKKLKNMMTDATSYQHNITSVVFCEYDEESIGVDWEEGTPVDVSLSGTIRMFAVKTQDHKNPQSQEWSIFICAQPGQKIMFNEDCSSMFSGLHGLQSFDFGEGLISTENVKDMSNMFTGVRATSIDLSGWDVSNVTNMSMMFYLTPNLETLDLSGWDVSNVKTMSNMFRGDSKLQTIYADDWAINPDCGSGKMFSGCTSLPGFDEDNTDASCAHTGEGGYFTAKK